MNTNLSNFRLPMKSSITFEEHLLDSFDFEIKIPVQKSKKEDVKPIIHTKPKGKKSGNIQKTFF